jgi:hypothetical protein
MSEKGGLSIVNPYQPTTSTSYDRVDIGSQLPSGLDDARRICFSGQATDDDVEELLRLTSSRGLISILLLAIVFGCLSVLMNAAWPWIMAAVGVAMMFLVMVSLLSRSYRRADFVAFNPLWDQSVTGCVTRTGYEVRTAGSREYMNWSSVASAYSSDTVVAFRSAHQHNLFRVIPRRALATEQDWTLLREVALSIHCDERDDRIINTRVNRAKAGGSDASRPLIVPPPADAITFGGPITGADVSGYEIPDAQRRVMYRSFFYGGIALAGLSAIIGGLSGLLSNAMGTDIDPTVTLALISIVVFFVFGLWVWKLDRQQRSPHRAHCVQLGFATDAAITVDFGGAARTTQWAQLRMFKQDDHCVVLSERLDERFITVRDAMFESSAKWRQFLNLAEVESMADNGMSL